VLWMRITSINQLSFVVTLSIDSFCEVRFEKKKVQKNVIMHPWAKDTIFMINPAIFFSVLKHLGCMITSQTQWCNYRRTIVYYLVGVIKKSDQWSGDRTLLMKRKESFLIFTIISL
jgi:hypothetical protein